MREANNSVLQHAHIVGCILHVHILLIKELIYRDSLIVAVFHLFQYGDSLGVHLGLDSEDSGVVLVLVVDTILGHLFLQFLILHERQFGDREMALEDAVSRSKIALVVEVDTILHQFLVFVVLQHFLLQQRVGLLVSQHLVAFLVQHFLPCQVSRLHPVVETLNHCLTGTFLIASLTEIGLLVLFAKFLITNQSCGIPSICQVLGLLVRQSLVDSGTSAGEIGSLLQSEVLCFLHVCLLGKAACAYQHQRCHNKCLFHFAI